MLMSPLAASLSQLARPKPSVAHFGSEKREAESLPFHEEEHGKGSETKRERISRESTPKESSRVASGNSSGGSDLATMGESHACAESFNGLGRGVTRVAPRLLASAQSHFGSI